MLGHAGAIRFSRTGDPSSGDFNGANVTRKFGEVPEDLSTLKLDWRRTKSRARAANPHPGAEIRMPQRPPRPNFSCRGCE